MIEFETRLKIDAATCKSLNLVGKFSERDLETIARVVKEGYEADENSRSKWTVRSQAAMDLALQLQKAKSFPWPDCSNVAFPLVTIGAMQWHARAYPALVMGKNLVRCRVWGPDPDGEKRKRADRVATHLSYQFLEEDQPWEEEHDRGLLAEAIVGTIFKKTHYSATAGHNRSELVLAKDLCLNYFARSVEDCSRKTHLFPLFRNEIYEKVRRGLYRDCLDEEWYKAPPPPPSSPPVNTNAAARADVRTGVTPPQPDDSTPFNALEQHVSFDFDGDGYEEPYVITTVKETSKVLRIVTRFELDQVERNDRGEIIRIQSLEYFTKYGFIPSPDGGIYDIGFGILLGPLNESVNSGINQLMDAGTMAVLAGGFLGRGAKFRSGENSFRPFGWNRVDATGDDLSKSIIPLPVREPSTVMFNLLAFLVDYTNRISGSTDANVGENPGQNTPKYNMQAMLQQGQMIYNAIFKRQWRCMKGEFRKAYIFNAFYLPVQKAGGRRGIEISKEDYLGDPRVVVPYADPNISSMEMRMQQAITLKQAAMTTPGYNRDEVEKLFLSSLQVESPELIYPGIDKAPPLPNPKAEVEKMKHAVAMQKMKTAFVEKLIALAEQHDLVRAQVDNLKAQAAKTLSEVGVQQASAEVQAFEAAVGAMTDVDEALRGHIDQAMEFAMGGMDESEGSKQGGVGGLAGSSGDKGSASRGNGDARGH